MSPCWLMKSLQRWLHVKKEFQHSHNINILLWFTIRVVWRDSCSLHLSCPLASLTCKRLGEMRRPLPQTAFTTIRPPRRSHPTLPIHRPLYTAPSTIHFNHSLIPTMAPNCSAAFGSFDDAAREVKRLQPTSDAAGTFSLFAYSCWDILQIELTKYNWN